MFDEAGSKIKGFSKILFVLEAIAAVIYGIVLMVEDEDLIILGLAVIVGGIFVSYITSLFLCAFGDLVESAASIVTINEAILSKVNKAQPVIPVVAQVPTATHTSSDSASPVAFSLNAKPNTWVCKNCGTENLNNYAICKKCGKYKNS